MAVVTDTPQAPVELIRIQLGFPLRTDVVVLAGAAKTITIPTTPKVSWGLFKVVGDVAHFQRTGTAAAPTADTQDGSNDGSAPWPIESTDGPQLYNVRGETSISVVSPAAIVYVSWYRDASDV